MNRQNLFSDAWDGENEEAGTRHRIFWRPDEARMGATLYELAPGAPEMRMHMHFGAEEMFFVLNGRPVFRNQHGEEELCPGDFVFCPEGRAGLHTFSNPSEEPAQILAISAGSFPDVVAYPEHGYAWVATRDPDPKLLARGGDPGIIARFEIPIEYRSAESANAKAEEAGRAASSLSRGGPTRSFRTYLRHQAHIPHRPARGLQRAHRAGDATIASGFGGLAAWS